MRNAIRVGIIGVSASQGWAREGHVPAIQMLEGLELRAVAGNSREAADAAAHAFGVKEAYVGGMELIRSSDVDLVTVATRVPDHRDLVLAALRAGKHVYCEWPLGRSVQEAGELASAAKESGAHVSIGLQLRGSPVIRRTRQLIASDAIGRLLSVNVYSATAGFGPVVPAPFVYLEDPANFANLITIQGGHTIDLAIFIAGPLNRAMGLANTQYPVILAGQNGEKRSRATFDHLVVQGQTGSGATLSAEVAGGRPPDTEFYMRVVGERGTLMLQGGAPRGFQSGRLSLTLNGVLQSVDEGELAKLPDAATNVGGAYASLRDDINNDTSTVTGFDHAVKLTQLLTDLLKSSDTGQRAEAKGWPDL